MGGLKCQCSFLKGSNTGLEHCPRRRRLRRPLLRARCGARLHWLVTECVAAREIAPFLGEVCVVSMPRARRQRVVPSKTSNAVLDAVLSNADLSTQIVTSLSSGQYLEVDRSMAWHTRRRKALNHLIDLAKLGRVNVIFRGLCMYRITTILEAFEASRVRLRRAVDKQQLLHTNKIPYTMTVHEEPFLALVAPIRPPDQLEDKAALLCKLSELKEVCLHAPILDVRTLDARLTPRCLCCRVDTSLVVSRECSGCRLEPTDERNWSHSVRFPDCAWLMHPYLLREDDVTEAGDPLDVFACVPLPFTSERHLVSMVIMRMSNEWEEGAGFETVQFKARVQLNNHETGMPPRFGTLEEQVVSVISTLRASGRLAPALERVCRLRYEVLQRVFREERQTLDTFQHEWTSCFAFRVELPTHRLLHGGLSIEDCSMAELFGLTDAEFDAYKLLGRDLIRARKADFILSADDWRRAHLETCLRQIECSGKGGSVWTLDAGADRLPRDTFVTTTTDDDAAVDMDARPVALNRQLFCTWRPGAFLTLPITTAVAARKARLVEKALASGPNGPRALAQSELRRFSQDHMLRHFHRVEQIAGLLTGAYRLTDETTRVVIQMVDAAIAQTPQKDVLPMIMWNGQFREHSSTFVHGDLVLRHLLYNVVHCNRMRVEVTNTMVAASCYVSRDPETKVRSLAFENAVVRLSIGAGGEDSPTNTYHRVRLLGSMSAKNFLELIHAMPAYDAYKKASGTSALPEIWSVDVLTSPSRVMDMSRMQAKLADTAADLSAFFHRRHESALQFLQTLLAYDRWLTFSWPATRVGTRELLYRNVAFYQPESKPLCESLKLARCLCNQRCTFSGRRANQCVFGPSTKRLSQDTLAFPHGSSADEEEED